MRESRQLRDEAVPKLNPAAPGRIHIDRAGAFGFLKQPIVARPATRSGTFTG
jgi:hypothetical protein